MLLDLVEVAMSHSGVNLAETFAKVLREFGTEDKVSFNCYHKIMLKLTVFFQILSITRDNASNNDKMVEHLATLIENFPGAANQTRCFAHILNLVAKSILRQFDVKKKTADDEPMDFDDAATALAELAEELDDGMEVLADDIAEELLDDDEIVLADEENQVIGDDDEDGLGNECKGMSDEEVADLEESVVPIQLMLTKVNNIIYHNNNNLKLANCENSFEHLLT